MGIAAVIGEKGLWLPLGQGYRYVIGFAIRRFSDRQLEGEWSSLGVSQTAKLTGEPAPRAAQRSLTPASLQPRNRQSMPLMIDRFRSGRRPRPRVRGIDRQQTLQNAPFPLAHIAPAQTCLQLAALNPSVRATVDQFLHDAWPSGQPSSNLHSYDDCVPASE